MFQHDNNLKSTAVKRIQWLKAIKIRVSLWPSRSTDLNCIENLWKKFQFRVHQRNTQNMSKLKVICQYEWNKIGTNFSEELI